MSEFEAFQKTVNDIVFNHPVVTNNEYCAWVAQGQMTEGDVKDLTIQFSVFSHLFLEAQLKKVLSSNTLEGYRAGKEILMNEFGVNFTKPGAADAADPNDVPTEGTVDGGKYPHTAAHFEWLLKFAEPLGLGFESIGKRALGSEETLHFCDALSEWYGNEDACVGAGASYAVENWAAAGFWKQLIAGLQAYNDAGNEKLNLGFWKWHDMVEDQHAEHTQEELVEDFEEDWFNEAKYLEGATHILDAVNVFFQGLNKMRLARAHAITA
jgi:pyrroloquinoline quinone (PQQ) biosynthesis protein C